MLFFTTCRHLRTTDVNNLNSPAQGSKSLFMFPGSGETGHLVEPRGAWERMLARSTALGLVEALAEKATAKTFDYQLALEKPSTSRSRPLNATPR